MSAIFKLNKSGVRLILVSEEDLSHLITVADSALGRTSFSTDPDTRMTAWQLSGTRLITSWSIAWLMAEPCAVEVLAGPQTGFPTWITRTSTVFRTIAVVAPVLTWSAAWWALVGTRLSALMTTHQGPTTV